MVPGRRQLPRPASVFTGRDALVDALLAELCPDGDRATVAVVTGAAGIGKTELVLQAAHRALDTPGRFPGGTCVVDLCGDDPDRRLTASDALGNPLGRSGRVRRSPRGTGHGRRCFRKNSVIAR